MSQGTQSSTYRRAAYLQAKRLGQPLPAAPTPAPSKPLSSEHRRALQHQAQRLGLPAPGQGNSIASVLDVIGRMPGNEPTPGYNPFGAVGRFKPVLLASKGDRATPRAMMKVFEELATDSCRWPMADFDRGEFLFCGESVARLQAHESARQGLIALAADVAA
jgi:hypothetical protein